MSTSRLASSPIDIENIYFSYADLAPETHEDAYAELGGRLHTPLTDPIPVEHRLLSFAAEYVHDKRKRDIERGLGGLGLLVLASSDIESMQPSHQFAYAAAVAEYDARLSRLPGLLRVEGSVDGGRLGEIYSHPGHARPDQAWADKYADSLVSLRQTLQAGEAFDTATTIKQTHKHEVHKQLHRPGAPLAVVHTTSSGKYIVTKKPDAQRTSRVA